jgi:LysR family glycine cleavage system transcriptional activator
MARHLPSLNQLRAFEAAARHLSFKDGADELCVTQAAVSHQIKALETALGMQLFHRTARGVRLTDGAETYLAALTGAFDDIAAATSRLRDAGMSGVLRISAPPFYGNRWLLPKLPRFRARFPSLDLHVSLSVEMVDLTRSDFDAAVRFGRGPWPNLADVLIVRDVVGPVCAPRYVAGRTLPLDPEEIRELTLATTRGDTQDWLDWFAAAGLPAPGDLRTVDHESSGFTFDAALSGNAVCLADVQLTASDEAGGALVRLHPMTIERPRGIHLVYPESAFPDPRLTALADWLKEEAAG